MRDKRYYCAVELAVDVIGTKWQPVILAHLREDVLAVRAAAGGQGGSPATGTKASRDESPPTRQKTGKIPAGSGPEPRSKSSGGDSVTLTR